MSKLIVMSGVPGSGKSYFSQTLKKMRRKHVYIVSSDNLRESILGDLKDISEEELIWKIFYNLPKIYKEDKNAYVILDATHINSKRRLEIVDMFKNDFDEIDLVAFTLDKELIKHQNIERENPVSIDVLKMFMDTYEYPSEEEYKKYDNVFVISTNDIVPVIYRIIED